MKREQEDSEDQDQVVQRVKRHDGFLSGTEFYWALPERKKRILGLYGFDFLPKDLQLLIAKIDAGGLLSLAQTNKMFADIARNDQVWKDLFQRDFPHDWKYCQGELPFFVITEDHPLWQQNFISKIDKSGWKRFYLNTRNLYVKWGALNSKRFVDLYNNYGKNKRNYETVIEHCSYFFVCVMAYLFKGRGDFEFIPNTPTDAIRICLSEINRKEIGSTLDWLKKYVICGIALESFNENFFSRYTNSEMLPDYDYFKYELNISQKQYDERGNYILFSKSDKENLAQFLFSKLERPGIFQGFNNLEENHKLRLMGAIIKIWNMIQSAYENKKSIYANPELASEEFFDSIVWNMVSHSAEQKVNVSKLIQNNPTVAFDLYSEEDIFSLPKVESAFLCLLNPLFYLLNYTENAIEPFAYFSAAPRSEARPYPIIFIACNNCNTKQASEKCGRCGKAFYCSKACQKKHWHSGEHKC